MTDHELHTLTGAYAADALGADERAAFELHMETCASCRAEVAELSATTALLAVAVTAPPPPGLRDRVLGEAARTRQLPPLLPAVRAVEPAAQRPWYRQPLAAAAGLLLVVAVGLGALAAVQSQRAGDERARADQIAALATDPDRTVRTVDLPTGGTATVVAANGLAVFRGSNLPRLPDGKAYQLWRVNGQESQSAGVLGRGGELTGVVTGVGPGDEVGVTVEPAAGSDHPTTKPIFLVRTA